jgi:hypothetical protein
MQVTNMGKVVVNASVEKYHDNGVSSFIEFSISFEMLVDV